MSSQTYEETVVETEYTGDVARKFNWPDLDSIHIPMTKAATNGVSGLTQERKEKLRELTKQKQNGVERESVRGGGSYGSDGGLSNGHVTAGGPDRGRQVERDSVRRQGSGRSRNRSSSRSSDSRRVSRSPTRTQIRSPSRKGLAQEPTEVEEELNDRLINKTHEVKSLQRDKQVLRQRTVQMHQDQQKASQTVDKERRNRVRANISKYEAEQRAANVERQYKLKLARLRQIDDVWAALDEAFMTLEKQNKQMEEQKEEMDLLKQKNQEMEQRSQEMESQIYALTKERDEMKDRISDLEAQNLTLERQRDDYMNRNQELRNRNSELESRLTRAEEDAAKFKNQVTELQVDKANLRQQVADLNSALSDLRDRGNQLERQRDDARRENEGLKRDLDRVADERDRLTTQNTDLENQLRAAGLEREKLQNEIARLKSVEAELGQAQRDIEELTDKLSREGGKARNLADAVRKMCEIGQTALESQFS